MRRWSGGQAAGRMSRTHFSCSSSACRWNSAGSGGGWLCHSRTGWLAGWQQIAEPRLRYSMLVSRLLLRLSCSSRVLLERPSHANGEPRQEVVLLLCSSSTSGSWQAGNAACSEGGCWKGVGRSDSDGRLASARRAADERRQQCTSCQSIHHSIAVGATSQQRQARSAL